MTLPYHLRLSASVPETSVATGIPESTLWDHIAHKRIETTKVGRRRLVLVRSVLNLIDPGSAKSAAPQEAA